MSSALAQERVMVVRNFEYVKSADLDDKSPVPAVTRHLVQTDSLRAYFNKTMIEAMDQKWGVKLDLKDFYVRGVGMYATEPKFKTDIKDRDPAKWYLFMQLYDRGRYVYGNTTEQESFGAFRIRCKVLSGAGDSVIFSRDLDVKFFTHRLGDDQVPALRLGVYPSEFKRMADSITKWVLMEGEERSSRELVLKPACLFTGKPYPATAVKEREVSKQDWGIIIDAEHAISIKPLLSETAKGRIHRNIGGNIATGAITLLTGIGTSKQRSVSYEQHFPFDVDGKAHHVYIRFKVLEGGDVGRGQDGTGYTMNSTDYSTTGRSLEKGEENELLEDSIRVMKFSLAFIAEPDTNLNRFRAWDGKDSSSIFDLSEGLHDADPMTNIEARGDFEGKPFILRSYVRTGYKIVFLEDRVAIMFKGKRWPERVWTYQELPDRTIRLFALLAMIPYGEYR
jgi:hypothetical protein